MSPSVKPFDKARYKALMDGLECSEVKFSSIDLGDRFDAEFFSKDYLSNSAALSTLCTKKLEELSDVVASAFYPAATQLYAIGDTPFVRCVDCIDYPVISNIQERLFERIPTAFADANNGILSLGKGEIIITKVGTPCYASVITDYTRVALSRTVLGLKNIRGIDAYYLMVFLRSKYGFEQLYRQRELTIQYQLTLPRVKAIDVFLPGNALQQKIHELIDCYAKALKSAIDYYNESLSNLNAILGFDSENWNKSGSTVKSFSESFGTSGRLDAEYYQPKYDDLFALLAGMPTKTLGGIVEMTKSIEPGSEYYGDEGIPFIRVSDVSTMGIDTPSIRIPKTTVPSIERLYPKKDTILFSKDGSVGIAYKVESDLEAVTSSALLHFRVKNPTEVLPDYLTLVLNSEIVQLQAERDASGAIIQHWKPDDIANVVIPILPYDVQKDISDKAQESFALRKEAEKLIAAAVRAVEIAIERGETAAAKYVNGNI